MKDAARKARAARRLTIALVPLLLAWPATAQAPGEAEIERLILGDWNCAPRRIRFLADGRLSGDALHGAFWRLDGRRLRLEFSSLENGRIVVVGSTFEVLSISRTELRLRPAEDDTGAVRRWRRC